MGIGLGLFMLALGAILTWAVDFTVSGLDIRVVGIILMLAGAVSLALGIAFLTRSRRAAVIAAAPRERVVADRVATDRVVERDVI